MFRAVRPPEQSATFIGDPIDIVPECIRVHVGSDSCWVPEQVTNPKVQWPAQGARTCSQHLLFTGNLIRPTLHRLSWFEALCDDHVCGAPRSPNTTSQSAMGQVSLPLLGASRSECRCRIIVIVDLSGQVTSVFRVLCTQLTPDRCSTHPYKAEVVAVLTPAGR